VYARPADPGMVSKVLQKSSGLIGSAADRVSSSGSSFTSSLFSYAQAVGERVKSFLPAGAAAVEGVESEQDAADRLVAASTVDAGADMIRQAAAEQRAKDAAEQRIKAAKGMEEKDSDDAAKNPLLKAIPALKPQLNPKQLPNEVQKRPNDPSQRQPCRVYPWLSLWKEYSDREVSSDGGDIKYIHIRRPFSSAEAVLKKRDPSLPLVSSHLDKEIGWITPAERAHFEDALFSQPVGRCCEGRLSAEREALQKLIQKTQLDLRNRANLSVESDGSVTQRSTASNTSAMATAVADEAAQEEQDQDDGDDSEMIAMLPSYETSKTGTILWTYMDKMVGNLDKLKVIRKHDRPDDLKSYLPARCAAWFHHLIESFCLVTFAAGTCVSVSWHEGSCRIPWCTIACAAPRCLKATRLLWIRFLSSRRQRSTNTCAKRLSPRRMRAHARRAAKTFATSQRASFRVLNCKNLRLPKGMALRTKRLLC
jgi:hypothetical protein